MFLVPLMTSQHIILLHNWPALAQSFATPYESQALLLLLQTHLLWQHTYDLHQLLQGTFWNAVIKVLSPYVYWTVHHLDSWIKRDQLDVTCFIISLFNAQHVSDVNTSISRSLRLICWVISWVVLLWFDMRWCYVVVWLGWCGICMQAEALEH